MRKRATYLKALFFLSTLIFLLPIPAYSVPVLQVYNPGATPGDMGSDQDTWFTDISSPFEIWVLGAYKENVVDIFNGYLVVSVPEGEIGTINVTGISVTSDPNPTSSSPANFSPTKNPPTFLPENFNNHYPFQDSVSDFYKFSIGDFSNLVAITDYNADDGSMNPTTTTGEIKKYEVASTGFSKLHFDAIAQVEKDLGQSPTWEINPGSHDASAVPEPATMLLLGSGLAGLAGLGRKFIKK